jgi:eukaryotic-like serine/threonine-protein kinase
MFEGYVIDAVLGHGGCATVYRAHDAADAQHAIALKVLADDHRGPAELRRLQREFDFAKRLRHPQVITVSEHGDGWLAMALVDGGTVATLHSLSDHLTALAQIADALDYVHSFGIVHCDVKPSNILVFQEFSRDGAVLIDFGVAHSVAEDVHRRPQQVQASLPYIAPEVLRGRAPSAVTDEYGLACTTVELVTGSPPFVENTTMALIDAHLNRSPPRTSGTMSWLPRAFDSIIGRAMAKDPEVRYQTCTEFVSLVIKVLK